MLQVWAGAIAFSGLCLVSRGAEPAAKAEATLPSWISELSVSAKETYDSNVYGSNEVLAAGYPDLVNKNSWVTSLGVRFVFSASALEGANKDLLVLGYTPTYFNYGSRSDENNTQHRFQVQSKGKAEAWSWNFDNATTYVDGSRETLRYTGYSSYGIGFPRERRAQWQDQGKFFVKYGLGEYFVRAAGSVTLYDLLTSHHVTSGAYAGWLNFVDRYDANAGLDVGWNITKDTALTLGWRNGHQYQQAFYWLPSLAYTSSNNYNRALVGIEGKPLSWLTLNLTAGPDFRHYTAPTARLGVNSANQTALYLEASATATLGKSDTLTLAGKQWRWVSSTGRVSYDDKSWQLSWKHKFNAQFSAQLSTQFQQGQYVNYPTAISATGRNDLLFTNGAQVQWTVTKAFAVTLEDSWQKAQNNVAAAAATGREFERNQLSLGAKYTF